METINRLTNVKQLNQSVVIQCKPESDDGKKNRILPCTLVCYLNNVPFSIVSKTAVTKKCSNTKISNFAMADVLVTLKFL